MKRHVQDGSVSNHFERYGFADAGTTRAKNFSVGKLEQHSSGQKGGWLRNHLKRRVHKKITEKNIDRIVKTEWDKIITSILWKSNTMPCSFFFIFKKKSRAFYSGDKRSGRRDHPFKTGLNKSCSIWKKDGKEAVGICIREQDFCS